MNLNIEQIKKQLLKLWNRGAFHVFIGSFLTKFAAFFGSIFLVRVLTKESYGILSYIENLYGYIYIMAGMGLNNAILRYVVLKETLEEKYGYYKYVLKAGTYFNIILLIFIGIGSYFYPHPEEFQASKWLLIAFLMALPFQFLMDSNTLTYRAMFDNKQYATTTFVTSSVLILFRYIAAIIWDLKGVIIAKIFVNIFFGSTLCYIIYRLYFANLKSYSLMKQEKKIVNKYSIQYMITNGLWAIFMLNDIFLLGKLSGDPTIIADYKVAYVLPGNLSIFSIAIGIFVGPYFVKHEKDYNWIRKNYIKTLLSISSLTGLAALILYIFANPIITLLYGIQYKNVVPTMRLLLVAAFANSGLRYTSAHLLASMGQIKYNMIVSAIGVLLQIAINIIVIPVYGAVGVAWTSIGVYLIMAVIMFFVFSFKYKLFKK